MKKSLAVFFLVIALLLCGCDGKKQESSEQTTAATEETVPATIPADGNPNDVTCKGSYTGIASDAVVATAGTAQLTGEQLQVWYWAGVSQYRKENHETMPDFDRPLDAQACGIDSSVNSWQQYFLKQALSSWHSAQALIQHSESVPMPTEEAYQPNLANHEKYMTGMPATKVLYGYNTYYVPNSMHQAYLDNIPQMLENLAQEKGYGDAETMAKEAFGISAKVLEEAVRAYNLGYMYFTTLSHDIEPTQEELDAFYAATATDAQDGIAVDFRQILLIPGDPVFIKPGKYEAAEPVEVTVASDGTVACSEDGWAACEEDAQAFLKDWQKNSGTEATFGEAAHKYTQDPGTAVNGGRYQGIRKGQMTKVLDDWCFDPARQAGETAVLRSDYGVHILYFSGSRTIAREESDRDYHRQQQDALILDAKKAFPMEVTYSAISLQEAKGQVSAGDILYPDIAHERFPEVPLYLQQDYPKTMYGGFKITTNGCGITTFAMVASYLTDNELTPPEMCERYGRYSHANGTDGMIFNIESAVLGFYLREKTYDPRVAKAALEDGHLVVSIQHPGYWTRGGHYIACESINDEGLVQVRDSNIYNYFRVRTHVDDTHKWSNITAAGSGYWIFEDKTTRIPACSRCGNPEGVTESLLQSDYICEKCSPALLRRDTYLNA